MPAKKTPPAGDTDADADAKLNSIINSLATLTTSVQQQQQQLSAITSRLDKVDLLTEQLGNIEESLKIISSENVSIKSTLAANQANITSVQSNQIRLDQYQRSWSVRVMELQLSPQEEDNPFRLAEAVYTKVFLPILNGALSEDLIPKIPSCDQLLELAHVLPASKPGSIKPIICRFLNRDYRSICFRLKKKYATRSTSTPPGSGDKRPRYAFPFYEDLSAATFKKMKEVQADSRVESCWSVNGQLRFRLAGSDTVKRVYNIMDPIDTIIK
jgi:hypothetical protein